MKYALDPISVAVIGVVLIGGGWLFGTAVNAALWVISTVASR